MIFLYRPKVTLTHALFYAVAWGVVVVVAIIAPRPLTHPPLIPIIFASLVFCFMAFRAVTAAIWAWRGATTFYTAAWRQDL